MSETPEIYLPHRERREFLYDLTQTGRYSRTPEMVSDFRREINLARADLSLPEESKTSSLSYIETPADLIRSPESCDMIVSIGGSNLIISKGLEVVFRENIGAITDGIKFLDYVANILSECRTSSVSVDFAFPVELITNSYGAADGKMIGSGSKGHNLSNLHDLNMPIGEYLTRKIESIKYVQLANDTILGLASAMEKGKEGLVIVGTGFNMAIYVNGKLVNLEAGAYNKFRIPIALTKIDSEIHLPQNHPLEKSISGCGIDPLYNLLRQNGNKLTTEQIFDLAGGFDINNPPSKVKSNTQLAQLLISNARAGVAAIEQGARQYIGKDIEFGYIGSVAASINRLAAR